jgi:hypothetical protein
MKAIATCTVSIATIAALSLPAGSQPAPDDQDAWPCIVLVQHGGNSPNDESGLRLAVWPDGAALVPRSARGVGPHLLVGTLDPEEVASALGSIKKAGFFTTERYGYAVPDGDYAIMLVRADDGARAHCWHECLSPGYGGNINTDLDYLSFVRMWNKAASALCALTPSHVQRLPEYLAETNASDFRGYNPDEPFRTPWMKSQNW